MSNSRLFWIVAATTVAAAVGASGCASERVSGAGTAEAALPAVAVVRADHGTLESAIELSGNLVPETRVDIRSKLAGTLETVPVQLGAALVRARPDVGK